MKTNQIQLIIATTALMGLSACFGGGGAKSDPTAANQGAPAQGLQRVAFNALSSESGCSLERVAEGAKLTCGDRYAVVEDGPKGEKGDPGDGLKVIRRGDNIVAQVLSQSGSTLRLRMVADNFEGDYDAWTGLYKASSSIPVFPILFESGDCSGTPYAYVGGDLASQSRAPGEIIRSPDNRLWKVVGRQAMESLQFNSSFSGSATCGNNAPWTGLLSYQNPAFGAFHTIEYIGLYDASSSSVPSLADIAPLKPELQ